VSQNTPLTFELTMTDRAGNTATDTVTVTITPLTVMLTLDSVAGEDTVNIAEAADLTLMGTVEAGATLRVMVAGQTLTAAIDPIDATQWSAVVPAEQITETGFEVVVSASTALAEAELRRQVTVDLTPPTAEAGNNRSVTEGSTVMLDANNSTDAVSYSWSAPTGFVGTLRNANTATPSFRAQNVSQNTPLTFELTVTDRAGNTATDEVTVTVTPLALSVLSIMPNDEASTTNTAFFTLTAMPAPTSDLDVRVIVSLGNPEIGSLVALSNPSAGDPAVAAQNNAHLIQDGPNITTIPAGQSLAELVVQGVGGSRVTVTVETGAGYRVEVGTAVVLGPDVAVSENAVSVRENGGMASYTLALTRRPTGDVRVTPTSSDRTVANVSGPLTFSPSNWNQPQAVTVTGVDDVIDNDPDRTATINHTVSGGGYDDVRIDPVMVTATDDDTAGVTVLPIALTVDEAGGTSTYTVVLRSQPTVDMRITPTSEDRTVARVSEPLSFTPSNWNQPQTVTVTGVDDNIINDPARRTVKLSRSVTRPTRLQNRT